MSSNNSSANTNTGNSGPQPRQPVQATTSAKRDPPPATASNPTWAEATPEQIRSAFPKYSHAYPQQDGATGRRT